MQSIVCSIPLSSIETYSLINLRISKFGDFMYLIS